MTTVYFVPLESVCAYLLGYKGEASSAVRAEFTEIHHLDMETMYAIGQKAIKAWVSSRKLCNLGLADAVLAYWLQDNADPHSPTWVVLSRQEMEEWLIKKEQKDVH